MADQEGADLSPGDIEKMTTFRGPEAQEGHHSSRFVEGLLSDIRQRGASEREERSRLETDTEVNAFADGLISRTHMPTFMTDFFSESINDGIDNKIKGPDFRRLKELRETAASVAAGLEVRQDDLVEIREYIDEQLESWRKRSEDLEGDDQIDARENQGIFRAFQIILEKPVVLTDIPNGPEEPAETTDAEALIGHKEMPEFEYKPTKFIEKQDVENVSLTTLYDYLADARQGLYDQERKFKEEDTDAAFMSAVESAWDYSQSHEDDTEPIMVVAEKGKIVYRGNIGYPKEQRQGKDMYVFTPDTHMEDVPEGIGTNAKRLHTYKVRLNSLDDAVAAVGNLLESDDAKISNDRDGEENLLAITRILTAHRNAIMKTGPRVLNAEGLEGPETKAVADTERQWQVLSKLSLVLKERTPKSIQGVFTDLATRAAFA